MKTTVLFFAFLFFTGFILNLLWEMTHMRAYAEMAGRPWIETLPRCTLASLGDAVTTLGIFVFYALLRRRLPLSHQLKSIDYLWLALLAIIWAVGFEHFALFTGRWSYNPQMPVIPGLGVGLWPLLQLTLLVPLSAYLSKLFLRARLRARQ
ncbi:MAG TPA: hypothetical protein VGK99_18500 [Acidobacteriota bacterium]